MSTQAEAKQVAHTPDVDAQVEKILRAAGSSLRHYMPHSRDELRGAMREVMGESRADLLAACEEVHRCGNGGAKLSRKASDMVRAALARAGAR